jgi:hypothetical protein
MMAESIGIDIQNSKKTIMHEITRELKNINLATE